MDNLPGEGKDINQPTCCCENLVISHLSVVVISSLSFCFSPSAEKRFSFFHSFVFIFVFVCYFFFLTSKPTDKQSKQSKQHNKNEHDHFYRKIFFFFWGGGGGGGSCNMQFVISETDLRRRKSVFATVRQRLRLLLRRRRTLDGDACLPNESGCPLQLLQVAIELVPQLCWFWPHVPPQTIM